MAKGRDKQGREQKKPKKAKKQLQDLGAPLPPLRHHTIATTAPAERSEPNSNS